MLNDQADNSNIWKQLDRPCTVKPNCLYLANVNCIQTCALLNSPAGRYANLYNILFSFMPGWSATVGQLYCKQSLLTYSSTLLKGTTMQPSLLKGALNIQICSYFYNCTNVLNIVVLTRLLANCLIFLD